MVRITKRREYNKRMVCPVCGRVFYGRAGQEFCTGLCKQLAWKRQRAGLPISDVACPKRRRRRVHQRQ